MRRNARSTSSARRRMEPWPGSRRRLSRRERRQRVVQPLHGAMDEYRKTECTLNCSMGKWIIPAPREPPGRVASMTEAEWLASRNGHQILLRMPAGQFTPRKHLLLACGCLRYHLEHNSDP